MSLVQQYRNEILDSLEVLPEEMVSEIKDFTEFLLLKSRFRESAPLDEAHLRLQQKALKRVWDHPDEELYEL